MNKLNKKLAPITLFTYNRPWHTRQTVEALKKNQLANQSDLIIFSDAAKNSNSEQSVQAVRDYLKIIDGFKSIKIIERTANWGLAKSIISGVTDVVNEYGKVIVLEDDLVTSPYFLKFMNDALEYYQTNNKVMSITGYSFPNVVHESYEHDVYFFYRCMSWGWATWKNRWHNVDWQVSDALDFFNDSSKVARFNRGGDDLTRMLRLQLKGKINSWAIRWCYHHFKHDAYCTYPKNSLVYNMGFDGSGVHCGTEDIEKPNFDLAVGFDFINNVSINQKIAEKIQYQHKRHLIKKVIKKLRSFL